MGAYTRLNLAFELKQHTPDTVLDVLRFMCYTHEEQPGNQMIIPDHPLFITPRWTHMLQGDSYYFPAEAHSKLIHHTEAYVPFYELNVECNLKNYDGEIEKFVDWVMPYVDGHVGTFLGFKMFESDDLPTLITLEHR